MKQRTAFNRADIGKYFLTYQITEELHSYLSFAVIIDIDGKESPIFEDAIPHYTLLSNHKIYEERGNGTFSYGTFSYGTGTFPTFLVYELTEDEILNHILVENI